MKPDIKSEEIISAVGAGLCLVDKNFKVVWVNDAQADWFGKKEELYGRHCYEVFEKRDKVCHGCPVKRAFETGKIEKATRAGILTRDGEKHFFQITASPVRNHHKGIAQVLELVQDITEEKSKDRKLHSALNKFSRMCGNLMLANKHLNSEVGLLRALNRKTASLKETISKKYKNTINKVTVVKEELNDLIKISDKISSTGNLKSIASLVARLSCKLMHSDASVLRILDENTNTLVSKGAYGVRKALVYDRPVEVGEGISGRAAALLKPQSTSGINGKDKSYAAELKGNRLSSVLAVPISFQGKALGVLTTYSEKRNLKLDSEEIKLLSAFASEIGIAINEVKLYENIHLNYYNTIRALVLAMEAKDPYTKGHADRVTKYSIELAQYLKFNEDDIEVLRYAGEVHDVGKIGISDLILNKPNWLTACERQVIQEHPVRGAQMIEPLKFLGQVMPLVKYHHERYDGSGYPEGLRKDKIPVMARIIACADAFDAMTSDRPYRKRKLTVDEALLEIKKNSGSQFDPRIANLFIKVIKRQL